MADVVWTDPNTPGAKHRRRDVGGGVLVEEVVALPGHASRVANGRYYMAGTGKLDLAVAGHVRATVENPAGSRRAVSVVRLAGLATGTGWADMFLNPTTGVPTSAPRPVTNALMGGGEAPVAVVRADTDAATALSGGTATGATLGIPSGAPFPLDLPPLVLAPGATLGIAVAFGVGASLALSVYWYEDPA
jgi:hypothetical protein